MNKTRIAALLLLAVTELHWNLANVDTSYPVAWLNACGQTRVVVWVRDWRIKLELW